MSCFNREDCFAFSYDNANTCMRYTACANDSCPLEGHGVTTTYLRHCNNGTPAEPFSSFLFYCSKNKVNNTCLIIINHGKP